MKTPITDAVYPPDIIDREYEEQGDSYGWGTLNKMRNTARRLETDRAALLEALLESTTELEALMKDKAFYQGGQNILDRARAAIAKATGEDAR